MKIALVTDTYYPRINGVAASTRVFYEEFRKLGHDAHVYAPGFPGYVETDPNIHRFPSSPIFFDPEDRLARPKRDKALIQQFIDSKYDIVHTQTPFSLGGPAVDWARKSGAKVVHTYHTLFTAYVEFYLPWVPKSLMIWLTKAVSRRYCNRCDLIITPSHPMKCVLESYGLTHRPIEAIPTGINLSRFAGEDGARFRRDHGLPSTDRLLMFMGRVSGEKNIAFLVRVLKLLEKDIPHIKLLIAGEGAGKEDLRRLAQRLGLAEKVYFLGYLTGDDWRDCYAAADLFTFASVTETQGLVVTEAMAAGTPVVAVGRMGVRDVMESQRGGLLTEPNEADFAAAVKHMLTDPVFYAQKKAETRPEAALWSSNAMALKMLETYEKLLKTTD